MIKFPTYTEYATELYYDMVYNPDYIFTPYFNTLLGDYFFRYFDRNINPPVNTDRALGFVAWIIPEKKGRFRCDESCGEALGIENAATLTPPLLRDVLKWRYSAFTLSDNIMKQ